MEKTARETYNITSQCTYDKTLFPSGVQKRYIIVLTSQPCSKSGISEVTTMHQLVVSKNGMSQAAK